LCLKGKEIRKQKRKQVATKLLLLVALTTVIPACAGQEETQNFGTVMLEEKAQPKSSPDKNTESTAGTVVTGVIEKPEITPYGTHAITDEASGVRYALRSEEEGLLDAYTGQRATVFGEPVPGYENGAIEGGPPLLETARVEPATAGILGEENTVRFGLTIAGEAPENHSFYVESSVGEGGVICTTDVALIGQTGYPECRGDGAVNELALALPAGRAFDYRILKSQGVSQEVVSEGSEVAVEGLVINAFYSFAE